MAHKNYANSTLMECDYLVVICGYENPVNSHIVAIESQEISCFDK